MANIKLYVNLGAEERAVEFSSVQACRNSLNRAAEKPVRNRDGGGANSGNLGYKWKGRFYAKTELECAEILTAREHWRALNKGLGG